MPFEHGREELRPAEGVEKTLREVSSMPGADGDSRDLNAPLVEDFEIESFGLPDGGE